MIESKRYSCPRYVCEICGKVRPNPEMCLDLNRMDEWEMNGEGWYVFSDWTRKDRTYLCRYCALSVKSWIDGARWMIKGDKYEDNADQ